MAEYLIQDSTLAAIGNAIRAKEGTSGVIPVSEFASRIAAIETGVTVRRKTGTFTTNSEGKATVNCGFKPDMVVLFAPEANDDGDYFHMGFAFTEIGDSPEYASQCETADGITYFFVLRTDTGFTIELANSYDFDWNFAGAYVGDIRYAAVKYT